MLFKVSLKASATQKSLPRFRLCSLRTICTEQLPSTPQRRSQEKKRRSWAKGNSKARSVRACYEAEQVWSEKHWTKVLKKSLHCSGFYPKHRAHHEKCAIQARTHDNPADGHENKYLMPRQKSFRSSQRPTACLCDKRRAFWWAVTAALQGFASRH